MLGWLVLPSPVDERLTEMGEVETLVAELVLDVVEALVCMFVDEVPALVLLSVEAEDCCVTCSVDEPRELADVDAVDTVVSAPRVTGRYNVQDTFTKCCYLSLTL